MQAKEFNLPEYIFNTRPTVLFHWTSPEGLRFRSPETKVQYGRKILYEGALPLLDIGRSGLNDATHDRLGRVYWGLFGWTDPILGMGPDNDYAEQSIAYEELPRNWRDFGRRPFRKVVKDPTGEPARLITIKLSESRPITTHYLVSVAYHRASAIGSAMFDENGSPVNMQEWYFKDKKIDLIYHMQYRPDGAFAFQEWLVTNPEIVDWFSSDPEVARPYIEASEKKLQENPRPAFSDIHWGEKPVPERYREVLRHFFEKGRQGIPKYFLNPPIDCSKVLAG